MCIKFTTKTFCIKNVNLNLNGKIFILNAFICSFYFLSPSETGSFNEAVCMIRNALQASLHYNTVLKVQSTSKVMKSN